MKNKKKGETVLKIRIGERKRGKGEPGFWRKEEREEERREAAGDGVMRRGGADVGGAVVVGVADGGGFAKRKSLRRPTAFVGSVLSGGAQREKRTGERCRSVQDRGRSDGVWRWSMAADGGTPAIDGGRGCMAVCAEAAAREGKAGIASRGAATRTAKRGGVDLGTSGYIFFRSVKYEV
ncbi:hypothetical protein Nepgr_005434 [Nepenthes gracilis]|uniref:Uncharacterized protein n=1 Tax=Nepenthes gracilis TaxID=150966 RepID=A0AAD3S364_NEPGR|nr:hypothetical protein Nepgr_005434 [Nepenthes gracilis]